MSFSQLKTIYQAQQTFFASNQTRELNFRLQQLDKLEKMLKDNQEEFQAALQKDLGKHPTETYLSELGLIYRSLRTTKKNLGKWSRPQKVKTPSYLWPARSYTQAVPYGQSLIIGAFNYPLLLSLDPLIGSMAAGNVNLLALSENTLGTNELLLRLIPQYFNPEYFHAYVSRPALNQQVWQLKFDKIFFTGSTKVGKLVAQAASQHLTPLTLELGGKSPALVTKTANLSLAAERITWGKFLNAGQTCVAPDYVLVPEHLAAEFIQDVLAQITIFYRSNPKESPDYGRIVSEHHLNRLANIISADEKYLISGGETKINEKFVAPTLLTASLAEVQEGKLASMEEEIFGPILPIITYKTMTEVIDYLNHQPAPLAFYPFSQDQYLLSQLVNQIQFGGSTLNDTILHLSNDHLPFGGVGNSGMGRYHGIESFKTFSHQKSILARQSFLRLKVMYPPYTVKQTNLIKRFLR